MDRKIAVLGAGAIGASIGADLSIAGYDAALIDQWPAHVEAMKAKGLRIELPEEEFQTPVKAYHLCEVAALKQQFDFVLLAAKSYDTCWLVEFIKPYLQSDGAIVAVQNSLNEEWIAPIVGPTRVIGCVLELSAEVFTPGVVQRNSDRKKAWFGLGELHGRITPRLKELEKIMSCAGRVSLTGNVWGGKWTKLINSTMILAPFGMLGMQSWEATDIPEVFRLCVRAGKETMAVGAAHGYTTEAIFGMQPEEFMGSSDAVVEKLLRAIVTAHGPHAKRMRGVVLQDFLKKRPTEAHYLNGLVVRKGKAAGVPTPANEAIMHVVERIERGELKPQRSNLEIVEKLLG